MGDCRRNTPIAATVAIRPRQDDGQRRREQQEPRRTTNSTKLIECASFRDSISTAISSAAANPSRRTMSGSVERRARRAAVRRPEGAASHGEARHESVISANIAHDEQPAVRAQPCGRLDVVTGKDQPPQARNLRSMGQSSARIATRKGPEAQRRGLTWDSGRLQVGVCYLSASEFRAAQLPRHELPAPGVCHGRPTRHLGRPTQHRSSTSEILQDRSLSRSCLAVPLCVTNPVVQASHLLRSASH